MLRPPVRRRTSGELSVDTQRLRARGRNETIGTANTRDPNDSSFVLQRRPCGPPASWNPRLLKAAHNQAPAPTTQRAHSLAAPARSYQKSFRLEPGSCCPALLPSRRGGNLPGESPFRPFGDPGRNGQLESLVDRLQRRMHQPQPIERPLDNAPGPERNTCSAATLPDQVYHSTKPTRTSREAGSSANGHQ